MRQFSSINEYHFASGMGQKKRKKVWLGLSEILISHFLDFFRLLDILAARKDPRGLEGTILIDGKPQPANFKCMCGYVSQVGSQKTKSSLNYTPVNTNHKVHISVKYNLRTWFGKRCTTFVCWIPADNKQADNKFISISPVNVSSDSKC